MCQPYRQDGVCMKCGILTQFVQRSFDKRKWGTDVVGYAYEEGNLFVHIVAHQLLLFAFDNHSYNTA